MTDELKIFQAGEKITADETNDNNRYLLGVAQDTSGELQNYIDTQLNQFQNNLNTQISSINTQISTANANLNNLQSALNSISYTEKAATIGLGTTQMTWYLPQDGKQYLVWFEAARGAKNSDVLYVASNKQTIDRAVLRLDGDSGRSSADIAYCIVPTTSNGWIRFSGAADYIYLLGYCRI